MPDSNDIFRQNFLRKVSLVTGILMILVTFFRNFVSAMNVSTLFVAGISGLILILISLFVQKRPSWYAVLAHIFLVTITFNIGAVAVTGLGIMAPALSIFILTPIFAAFLVGKRGSVLYGFLVLVILALVLIFGKIAGINEIVPYERLGVIRFIVLSGIFIAAAFLGIAFEMSQKIADHEIKQLNENLKYALETKKIFFSNLSHEIRTPLNGILGMLHLAKDYAKDEDLLDKLLKAEKSGDHLLDLINNILDFSKLESYKVELESIVFNFQVEIEAVCHSFRAMEKQIDLTQNFSLSSHVWMVGDPGRLRQILFNLIGNAVKFSQGKKVEVIVTTSEALSDAHLDLVVQIRDHGPGIPKEHLDKLFQSFSQIDASTTRKFGGTGLGLAICKGLVDLMNGNITAQNVDDGGALFTINLPMMVGEPTDKKEKDSEQSIIGLTQMKLRILIAEDNIINQEILVGFLAKLGQDQIDIANNGEEAVAFAKKKTFDLILMDCQMPIKDGLLASKEIISYLGAGAPLIVALTAGTSDEEKELCVKAGMRGFMGKPIKRNELADLIENFESHELKKVS